MDKLKELVKDKRVCIIGSLPPDGLDVSAFDIVIRLNDWWAYDEGRADVLFHIGASPKIKVAWLLQSMAEKAGLKLVLLYRGAEHDKMKRILGYHKIDCVSYDNDTPELLPLRKWFNLRGHSPSTGMVSIYALCQCEPQSLHVTGMDLYAKEPDHCGWSRHFPLGHVFWIRKLRQEKEFLSIGQDLEAGIEYWTKQDREAVETGV